MCQKVPIGTILVIVCGCGINNEILCWNATAIKQGAEQVARTKPVGEDLEREMADIVERADLIARYHGLPPAKLERASPEDNHKVAQLHALVAQREHRREITEKIRRLPALAIQAVTSGIWSRIRWPALIALALALAGLAGWCWRQWRHISDTERVIVKWLSVQDMPKEQKRQLTGGTMIQRLYRRLKDESRNGGEACGSSSS